MTDWDQLSEPVQLHLAQQALREASNNLAAYADALAGEMERGDMADRGGGDALRLFASLVRSLVIDDMVPAGHA